MSKNRITIKIWTIITKTITTLKRDFQNNLIKFQPNKTLNPNLTSPTWIKEKIESHLLTAEIDKALMNRMKLKTRPRLSKSNIKP